MDRRPTYEELEQRLKELETRSSRADEADREVESDLDLLLSYSADAFVLYDPQLRYTFINRPGASLLGLKPDQVIGKTNRDIMGSRAEIIEPYLQEAFDKKEKVFVVHEIPLPAGKRAFDTIYTPVIDGDGNVIRVLGICRDISEDRLRVKRLEEMVTERTLELQEASKRLQEEVIERKRVEEILRQSKELFERIFTSQRDAIIVLDADVPPTIIDCNPATTEIFGYTPQEMVGQTTAFLHVDEMSLRNFREQLLSAIEGQDFFYLPEFKMKRKDGSVFSTEHNVAPLHDDQNRQIGWVSVVRDITRSRQSKERILKQNKLLEGINQVLLETVSCETEKEVARKCLAVAEELTGSKFGFIGEINRTGTYDNIALSNPGWDACKMPKSEAPRLLKDMEIRGIWRKVLKEGQSLIVNDPSTYPDRVGTPKGHPRITSFLGVPLKYGGKTIGMIGMGNKESGYDLYDQQAIETLSISFTEALMRKRAEETLRENEEKYRTLFENANEAILVAQDGAFKVANPKAEEIYGYSQEELTSRPFTYFIHEEDREMVKERYRKRINGEAVPNTYNFRIINKTGDVRWIRLSVVLFSWGEKPATLCFMTDITESKRAEEELRVAKDNLDKAQKIAHVGNWSRDLELNWGQWSDETYRILGLRPGDPEGPSFETFLTRVHPADRERVTSVLKEAIEKKGSFDFEFRTVPIEGKERIIRNRGEVECDETGAPVRMFGIDQDITETKRLQAQLMQAEKMEAIATLAWGIAHQFNNALTSITGYTGLLEMEYPEDERVMEYTKAMKESAFRMAHLTSQLVAYARGGRYNPEIISLTAFVRETLPLIQHTIDPDIHVETDLPLDTMNVEIDRTQMQMVLSAIVANSNEAIEGPGRIKISVKNMELDQESIKDYPGLRPGPHVCLSVEDDGKGMDEETKNRIFEPFFTTHFIGRGLGMASVYGIIKGHDGWISVDSEPGKGTVVHIYLPGIEGREKAKEEVVLRPEPGPARGEGTILVIEDEEQVIMLTRKTLERLGYCVLEARTGQEAVEITRTFDGDIDLALLDIKLPDMPGDRVYPLIMDARPDLKVIVCTGYSIEGPAQEILDAGAEGFIQKPFSISALSDRLKEVLEGK